MIRTDSSTVRFMREVVPEGVDPTKPGQALTFEPREVVLNEVLFDVQDEAACARFLAAALGTETADTQWADLAVNFELNKAAPLIFRPAAFA